MTPNRRWLRAKGLPAALAVSVTASMLSACSLFSGEPDPTRACGVVVDASGSGADFHADQRLRTKLDPFLQQQNCAQLTFVALNALSDTSICNEARLDLDPKVGDPDAVRTAGRKEALTRALRLLDCARKESSESDVLGALRKAGTTRPDGAGPYAVLVVSDMIQHDEHVNMLTQNLDSAEARAAVINQLGDLTPRLPDTVLYPTDLSTNIADAKRGQDVRAFWTELFSSDRSGRPRIEMTYG
jgi:hypothetical protein